MKRGELINRLKNVVGEAYSTEQTSQAVGLLTEHFYALRFIDCLLSPNQTIDDFDSEAFDRLCNSLLSKQPLQYIVGRTEFYGFPINVDRRVLIPRQETEELVKMVVDRYAKCGSLSVLDLCTGSGAIAIALARLLDCRRVVALDFSADALDLARQNALLNGVSIDFFQSDVLQAPLPEGEFDVVVSNPPYVPLSDKESMQPNVLDYEPHEALFVPDGSELLFYRAIAGKAFGRLKCGGGLFFEVHERFARQVADLLTDTGYEGSRVEKDINGRERMVAAEKR